jgi:hypothetical protein
VSILSRLYCTVCEQECTAVAERYAFADQANRIIANGDGILHNLVQFAKVGSLMCRVEFALIVPEAFQIHALIAAKVAHFGAYLPGDAILQVAHRASLSPQGYDVHGSLERPTLLQRCFGPIVRKQNGCREPYGIIIFSVAAPSSRTYTEF